VQYCHCPFVPTLEPIQSGTLLRRVKVMKYFLGLFLLACIGYYMKQNMFGGIVIGAFFCSALWVAANTPGEIKA